MDQCQSPIFIDNGKLLSFLSDEFDLLSMRDEMLNVVMRWNPDQGSFNVLESSLSHWSAFLFAHFVIVVDYDILFSEFDDMKSARQIEYGNSQFIENIYDEVIWDMMTLVGQIYFDIFRLPLGTAFINTKGSSMQADIFWAHNAYFLDTHVMSSKHQLFESLFTFIKYCEDDLGTSRGMSKSDIRESYGMLYQAFPFLRSPGRSGAIIRFI